MALALTTINTGIKDTLEANSTLLTLVPYMQDIGDLTEGLTNTPALQVYWQNLGQVSSGSSTDRHTFGGGSDPVRIKTFTFYIDVYLDPRAHLDQLFVNMLTIVDAVNDVLEEQDIKPYFGVENIKSFTWSAERGVTTYAQIDYPTVRWTIEIVVF